MQRVSPQRIEEVRLVCQELWDKSGHTRRPRFRDVVAITKGHNETIRKIWREWIIGLDAAENDAANGVVLDEAILNPLRTQIRRAIAITREDCEDAIAAARESEAFMAKLLNETEAKLKAVTEERDALQAKLEEILEQKEPVNA